MTDAVAVALDTACSADRGRIVSALIRVLGSIDAAEDALQGACEAALESWPTRGIPSSPSAWLTTVARRRAIDMLRRTKAKERVTRTIQRTYEGGETQLHDDDPYSLLARWPDERLKLMFMCCHPSLTIEARVALTLKEVNGLSTAAVGRVFLVTEATMAQRLVRAKRRLRDAGARFEIPHPDEYRDRLSDMLRTIYLLFTEGHLPNSGSTIVDESVCEEAIFLAQLVVELLEGHTPGDRDGKAEALGLLSLFTLIHARRRARTGDSGLPVTLEEQDRTLWNDEETVRGLAMLDAALALGAPGPYQIQAAINGLHHTAVDASDTDWREIHALYKGLYAYEPTPVVQLNQIVALGMCDGAKAALDELRALDRSESDQAISSYPYYYLACARFLEVLGRIKEARSALRRARELTNNEAEQAFITDRIARL